MKQRTTNLDNRIHAFISGKTSRTLSDSVADWLQVKFGGRGTEIQSVDPVIGMKYEPASRGKL